VQSKTQGNPGKMTEASLVFHNDFLYLLGVQDKNPYCSLFKLDLTTSLWSEVKTKNVVLSRKGQISVVFNNTLLVFFGYSGSQKFVEMLELDLLSLQWESSNSEEYLYGSSAQMFQNMVIFLLGRTVKSYQNSLRAYFFESRSLQNLTFSSDFPVARKNHVSWVYSNSVYIFGGVGSDGVFLYDIWKYDVKVHRWEFVQTRVLGC
jgi:N-acetylneuraminic acid mutarotase